MSPSFLRNAARRASDLVVTAGSHNETTLREDPMIPPGGMSRSERPLLATVLDSRKSCGAGSCRARLVEDAVLLEVEAT